MVVIPYIPLGSLGENWPLVAPLVLALFFLESLAPVVLFWVSLALSHFSPPTTTAVALPGCTHVSLKMINQNIPKLCDDTFTTQVYF